MKGLIEMAGHIRIGTKSSQYGWVDVEEVESVPDIQILRTVGVLVTETGASNIGNFLHDLKTLNGYKVRVTVEVLDHPDNRKETEKIPRPYPTVLELLDQEIAKCT